MGLTVTNMTLQVYDTIATFGILDRNVGMYWQKARCTAVAFIARAGP